MIIYICCWLIVAINTLLSNLMTMTITKITTKINLCLITSELDRTTLNRSVDSKAVLVYLP